MRIKEVPDYAGYSVTEDGKVIGKRGSVLAGKVTWDGYREIILSDGPRRRSVRVHVLVAELFIGDRPDGMVVNHKDGDKLNNSLDNLEFTTLGGNVRHAFSNGLIGCKGRPPSSYSREEFLVMKALRNLGWGYREICEEFSLSCRPDYLGEIFSGRKLSEVTGFKEESRHDLRTA